METARELLSEDRQVRRFRPIPSDSDDVDARSSETLKSQAMGWVGFGGTSRGTMTVLNMELSGLISPRMRRIIKRNAKKVGLRNIKAEHVHDGSSSTVRLVVKGERQGQLTMDQMSKLAYFETSLIGSLARRVYVLVPHPSRADPEVLPLALCQVEPSMERVFYTKA